MRRSIVLILCLALATACSGEAQDGAAPPGQGGSGDAPAVPGTGDTDPFSGPLPEGHPPMGGMQGGMPGGAMAGTQPLEVTWRVPKGWTESPGTNAMRLAQFDVGLKGAPGQPAPQLVVFKGIGGSNQANIDRWSGQFNQPDGSSSKDKTKVTLSLRGKLRVTRVEITGTHSTAMLPGEGGETTQAAALLGAILEAHGGRLFLKLVGPADQIDSVRAAFDTFLDGVDLKQK